MKGFMRAIAAILLCTLLISGFSKVHVTAAPSGTILIGQIKITTSNGQFVSLYNNTLADIDMSTVQLAYYNYYDLSSPKLTGSRYIPLSGKLPSHNYYMVSDGAMTICYKMTVNALSLGFSTTAGTVQVTQNGPANVLDSVAWSKTAVNMPTGVQTLPISTSGFLQRAWVAGLVKAANDPWISVTPAIADGCDLQTQIAASSTPVVITPTSAPQKVTTVAAPAPILDTKVSNNSGLVSPELTELFPNPAAPKSDDTDEFIELYNPNDAIYNLVGYRFEAGTSYSRGFTFVAGPLAALQPKSYTAFKITDTNLQLSNTEGQARLLDPNKTTISETPGYENAPEGESWSLVGDSWQWTNTPTPNAANLPSTLTSDSAAATAEKTTKNPTPPKAAKTTTAKKVTGKVAGASTTTPTGNTPSNLKDAAPIHPLVLVGVGVAAVGYAVYEYRTDMANYFHRARRYFRRRQAARQQV